MSNIPAEYDSWWFPDGGAPRGWILYHRTATGPAGGYHRRARWWEFWAWVRWA